MGQVLVSKQVKCPTFSPIWPGWGVVGHNIDRCITGVYMLRYLYHVLTFGARPSVLYALIIYPEVLEHKLHRMIDYVCMHIYGTSDKQTRAHVYTCMHTHIQARTLKHTHTHTHTHTLHKGQILKLVTADSGLGKVVNTTLFTDIATIH